jgi:hypothetical protein
MAEAVAVIGLLASILSFIKAVKTTMHIAIDIKNGPTEITSLQARRSTKSRRSLKHHFCEGICQVVEDTCGTKDGRRNSESSFV